jgi:hypothetical protein
MIKLASFVKLLIINIENHVRNISNSISVQIYPDFKQWIKVHLLFIFHNYGNSPDKYFHDGIHTVMLDNQKWNKVNVEIPHLGRDKVTRFSINGGELVFTMTDKSVKWQD